MSDFFVHLDVRVSDLNYGAHLGHDRLLGLIHEARCLWLEQHGMTESDADGCALVMRQLNVEYLAQGYLHDKLTITLRRHALSAATFTLECIVKRAETLLARAYTCLCAVNPHQQRPCRLSRGLKTALEALEESNG